MYRPLSPHLFIYKPQVTSIFSVLHRTTGIILAIMLVVGIMGIKLTAGHVAQYPIYYVAASLCTLGTWPLRATILGILVLTWCVCYHALNGIRHMIWDFAPQGGALSISKLGAQSAFILFFSFLCGSGLGYSCLHLLLSF